MRLGWEGKSQLNIHGETGSEWEEGGLGGFTLSSFPVSSEQESKSKALGRAFQMIGAFLS